MHLARLAMFTLVSTLGTVDAPAAVDVAQAAAPRPAVPREQPLTRLRGLVENATGGPATSCGEFLIERFGEAAASANDLQRGIECLGRHGRARTSAWLVVQHQGIDSWIASGLLVDATGRMRSFSFDSDPSGGSSVGPRLSFESCLKPRVSADVEPRISCLP